jgi:hypothetical protein
MDTLFQLMVGLIICLPCWWLLTDNDQPDNGF